ncbi:unnamed protein product [Alternaria burnsii]|nr:unnamed protein product [Alternaria burnsii]
MENPTAGNNSIDESTALQVVGVREIQSHQRNDRNRARQAEQIQGERVENHLLLLVQVNQPQPVNPPQQVHYHQKINYNHQINYNQNFNYVQQRQAQVWYPPTGWQRDQVTGQFYRDYYDYNAQLWSKDWWDPQQGRAYRVVRDSNGNQHSSWL